VNGVSGAGTCRKEITVRIFTLAFRKVIILCAYKAKFTNLHLGNVMARTSLEMLLNIRVRAEWKFHTSSSRMKIRMGLGVILGFIIYIHIYVFIVMCID